MVDNVTLNSGTGGAVAAADDISSVFFQRVKVTLGADGVNDGDISSSNPVPAILAANSGVDIGDVDVTTLPPNVVDSNNSTTTPLGSSATFTGTGTDVLAYDSITVQLFADQDGAAAGMRFEFSTDNTNWDASHQHDYLASTGRFFQFSTHAQFFRVVFVNGSTVQGAIRIQTILHRGIQGTSIHRLDDDLTGDRSATVTKSVVMAQAGGTGNFTPMQATNGGNFKVAIEEYDGVPSGGGTESGSLRVTLASDSTGLLSVDDNGGSLTVDGTVTANAGTGTFTVDGSGVTQPVSAASLPLPTGAATSAAQLPDGHNVTVDNASGVAAVNIQDGGNSITVDGTVTANLSATDNAVLDQIEVNTSYGDNTGGGVEAGSLRVTIANDSTGLVSVDDNGGSLTVDNGGTFATQATLQAGSALAGDVGLSGARTSGGTTLYKNIDVDESEDQIKGTAGQVYWIHAVNVSATVKYLKFYNATAASVTVGTTVPDLTFPVPTQGDTNGAGFTLSIPNGIAFGTAITIAATTGVADNDSGAPGANEVIVNLGYA